MMNSEACSILLIHEETEDVFIYTSDSKQKLDESSFSKGKGIIGSVASTGESVISNNVHEHPKFYKEIDGNAGITTHSMMCVPMILKKRVLGTMQTFNKIDGEFTYHDLRLLDLISMQAIVAVEYLRANEQKIVNERMAKVGNMAGSIIHDLRNSMHVISGFSQIISIEDKNASFTEYCESINKEIGKLMNISHELLEFARGSNISLSLKAASLNDYLRFSYHQTKKFHEEKGIDFHLELYEDCYVELDQDKMALAIQNLLRKARVAVKETGEKKITLKGGLSEGLPVIIVEDTGAVMDRKALKNVFKPFYSKERKGAIGIEMAITKNIVDGHRATIKAESVEGKGTRFIITFEDYQSSE
jgi:signal transduction histidine kinase